MMKMESMSEPRKRYSGEDGEIREGCSIVKKGEVYEKKLFTVKEERFRK